jgi:hypothetical protein
MSSVEAKPKIPFELSTVLKNAEPFAVLASLTLILAVFTFDHLDKFQNVYNYSVLASTSFILSFIFFILSKLVELQKLYDLMLRYGTFFFLAIGLVHLLMIMYEFSKDHAQIFSFYQVYWLSFGAGICCILIRKLLIDDLKDPKRHYVAPYLQLICAVTGAVGGLVASGMIAIEGFTGYDLPESVVKQASYVYYAGFVGFGIVAYADIFFLKRQVKQVIRKLDSKISESRAPIRVTPQTKLKETMTDLLDKL